MNTQPTPNPNRSQAIRIPVTHRIFAAQRLVNTPDRQDAARRLVSSAQSHGIDLDLMWGVIPPTESDAPHLVSQVALAVLGAGKTAMIFLSTPTCPIGATDDLGAHDQQVAEITSSVRCALDGLRALAPDKVALAQTLLETEHTWAHRACIDGGMISVGTLAYLRKPIFITQTICSTDSSSCLASGD